MKITTLYTEKPAEGTCLVTGQVLSNNHDSDRTFELEATLQFVQGSSAVEYDFSSFLYVAEDGSDIEKERERLAKETEAVDRLVEHVIAFQQAYLKAADRVTQKLDALSA